MAVIIMRYFKTVLGKIPENEIGITLSHEHICCYSAYLFDMAGKKYMDKEYLLKVSVEYLKQLKSKYGLNTFIDCTPVNIGRDIHLLKKVSELSEINIICATGFYYAEEVLLCNLSVDRITEHMITDANRVSAGIIKCAVEDEQMGSFSEKILRASARAQLKLDIPIVLHTNANNKNAIKALDVLFSEGVKPQAITAGHLSDTDDLEYIKHIAEKGCFVGFDRIYDNKSDEYIAKTVDKILKLCDLGHANKILLSHDALFFNGFEAVPKIDDQPRFSYCFDYILPRLPRAAADIMLKENPVKMLKCGE